MSKAQIEFLQRCKALNLHSGSLNDWLDRIEELERERDNAEQERAQFEQESDQLREHVTMLRDALLTCSVGDFSTGHVIPPSFDEKLVEEALAATEQKP